MDVIADTVDRVDDAVIGREVDDEVAYGENGLRHEASAASGREHRAARRPRS